MRICYGHLKHRLAFLWVWIAVFFSSARADSVVLFNEIIYHTPGQEPALEWVELHNPLAVDVDISRWSITGGIQFQFAEGTIIKGGGYRVIASQPDILSSATGMTNILGPFTGRLSNSGDTLELRNNDQRRMDRIAYESDGDWPVGANGSGMSLSKKEEDSASALAQNWTLSVLAGGTPGKRNFATTPWEVIHSTPISMNSAWKYQIHETDRSIEADWNEVSFDDQDWGRGEGLIQVGNPSLPPGELQPLPSVFSTGLDLDGKVLPPGSHDLHYWMTLSAHPLASPLPLAALVIQHHPSWSANDFSSSWIGPVNPGSANVAAGAYHYRTRFTLDGFDPATALLNMSLWVDNRLDDVLLNGIPQGIRYAGFSTPSSKFTLRQGFVPGTNTLDFLSYNEGSGNNPAGFRVLLNGSARKKIESKTVLPPASGTLFVRSTFQLTNSPWLSALDLRTIFVDGAVFYLNGHEVLRVNMPSDSIQVSTAALSNQFSPTMLGPFTLPSTFLTTGTNLLAAEIHRASDNAGNILFGAELTLQSTNLLAPWPVPLAINEITPASGANSWLELFNYGQTPIDLNGFSLTAQGNAAERSYGFSSQILNPGAFLCLDQATLGFTVDPGDRLFLYRPGRVSVVDAVVVPSRPRARSPDGSGQWAYPSELTPGRSNEFSFHHDVVINEIMYHAPRVPSESTAPSSGQAPDAWLELYNRSREPIDLTGWRLAGDIQFEFPAGAIIPPDAYLLVAKTWQPLHAQLFGTPIFGPRQGKLRKKGSRLQLFDSNENLADEVCYGDRKPWPEYSDGGGSGLELKDPWGDNSRAEAWAASDEQARSVWTNYTYRAVASTGFGPTKWKEFVIGLLDAGECLVDDLSVVENPSGSPVELLQNGSFETGSASWRTLGNHRHSRVVVDPDNPNNHVLHLLATGPIDHMHNHLETTLAGAHTVTTGREYQIRFRARWLAGNNRLNTRLYFNRLAQTIPLPRPLLQGTPGAINSRYSANMGPTMLELRHSPIVPKSNEPVTIQVSASDPHQVSQVTLWWTTNRLAWNQATMQEAGPSIQPGYTNYQARLPALPPGTLVQFYVQAADRLGAQSEYPSGGANSRALYKVDEGKPLLSQLHRLRLLMTPADIEQLHAPTNVMSNERRGLTLVEDDRTVYYDVGVHLQGSQRGRNNSSRVGFTIRFNADQLFHGVHQTITIDRSGGYSGRGGTHDEILLWHAVNHAGGILGFHPDIVQCFAPRAREDGTGLLRLSAFDGEYFDEQFRDGSDGQLYTLELIYYPTTSVSNNPQLPKLPQPDEVLNVDIQNWGNDKENYRWIFLQENHADQDEYDQLIALNKAFGLTGSSLEIQTRQLMDVDQWMRALAFKAFTGDGDTFTYGLNHNWKIYFRPEDGKAMGLLWDMDYAFAQPTTYAAPGSGSPNTLKLVKLPNNFRRFCQHLLDIASTTINASYLQPWAKHYSGLVGQDWSPIVAYLQQRAEFLLRTLPLEQSFAVTTQSGRDFTVNSNTVLLAGSAPLALDHIEINGVPFPLNWTSLTNWNLSVPLSAYSNRLVLQGVDSYGRLLPQAAETMTVTNINYHPLLPVVLNEWMADNSGPGGFLDPWSNRYSDWIELYNPNPVPVNLSGFSLTDTLSQPNKYQIPANTIIPSLGFLLIWADDFLSLNHAAPLQGLHAGFQLDKEGDRIYLFGFDGKLQHQVAFGSQLANVSQGLFPDGHTNQIGSMPLWTPRAANQTGGLPHPRIGAIQLQTDGSITFTVNVIPGRTYRVEYLHELGNPLWIQLGRDLMADTTSFTASDLIRGPSQRFYRVVLVQ